MSAMHTTTAQLLPLAKELDENKVTPGVLGFAVFAVMGLAVWVLMKSMNRHMGRVDFPEPAAETAVGAARTADPSGSPAPSGDGSDSGGKGPGASA